MSKTTVSVARVGNYEPAVVRQGIRDVLEPLGSMAAFVSRGDRVLIKPNFLIAKGVGKAVTTHPEVILAVVEAALDAGAAEVLVGDSPAVGSARLVARRIGLLHPVGERGARVVDFNSPVILENKEGICYKRFEVERTLVEVDKVINLAKVKTHGQMFLTLAVKNMFGAVVGLRKGAWHLEAGRDADLFATMILDLHCFLKPALNIVDGVVMMEGNGPNAGTPREWGVFMAGADATALDRTVCQALSLPLDQLFTYQVARRQGVGVWAPEDIALAGVPLEEIRIDDVKHPLLGSPGDFYVPGFLKRFARRLVEVRPTVIKSRCIGCELCAKQCPADAIDMVSSKEQEKAVIRPQLCIHCYCCQEVCPEGAIEPRRGLATRLMKRPS